MDSAAEAAPPPDICGRCTLSRQFLASLLRHSWRSNRVPRPNCISRMWCDGSAAGQNHTSSDTRLTAMAQVRSPPLALPLVILARAWGCPTTPWSALEWTPMGRPSLRPCDGACSASAVAVAAPLPGEKIEPKMATEAFFLPVAHLPSPAPPPISSSEPIDTQAREDASLLPRKKRQHLNFFGTS